VLLVETYTLENSNRRIQDVPLSILDLVPVLSEKTVADSFRNCLDLARKAEQFGFNRFWMSEHHNMEGVASSATVVLIGYVAGNTSSIRVGAGGIMLPNHAPLVVAEQFGTLETLYQDRIDLGLGRAPGTDPLTTRALRRDMKGSVEEFPSNVQELIQYLSDQVPASRVKAVPGHGTNVPVWLLGSSTYSAQLAAMLGLPFAFASHFAPALLMEALRIYRDNFQPSATLKEPYVMVGANVVAADSDEKAQHLATSVFNFFLNVVRGTSNRLQPPVDSLDSIWSAQEKYAVEQMLNYNFVGSSETVRAQMQHFVDMTQADEIMVVSNIYDHAARVRSYEIISQFRQK